MGDAAALTSVVLTVPLTVTETLNPGVDGSMIACHLLPFPTWQALRPSTVSAVDRAQFEFHHGLQVPHRDVGHLPQRYLGGVVPPQLVGVDKSLRRTVLDGRALLPEDDPDGLALVVGEYDRLSGGDPFAAVVFIRGLHAFAAAAERHRHRVPRTGRCRAHRRVVVSGLGA